MEQSVDLICLDFSAPPEASNPKPSALTDAQWLCLAEFFERPVGWRGRPSVGWRPVLCAILYIAEHGLGWRDLPVEFGPWSNAYQRYRRALKAGSFHRVRDLIADHDANAKDASSCLARSRLPKCPLETQDLLEKLNRIIALDDRSKGGGAAAGRRPLKLGQPCNLPRQPMSDIQWAFFAEALEMGPFSGSGRRSPFHRRTIEGLLWLAANAAPWKDLPPSFGRAESVRRQFGVWSRLEVWDWLLSILEGATPSRKFGWNMARNGCVEAARSDSSMRARVLALRALAEAQDPRKG